MSFEIWLIYLIAAVGLSLTPGPNGLLSLTHGVQHGFRKTVYTVIGGGLGFLVLIAASLAGLGALLAASEKAFTICKWIGAAYLVYLGIKLFRAGGTLDVKPQTDRATTMKMMGHAWVVTALNPKSITFFVAFLPQFLDLSRPVMPQMVIFEATFLVLATLNAFSYALLASAARKTIRNPTVQKVVNRTGGTLLIGAGLLTAGLKRAAA